MEGDNSSTFSQKANDYEKYRPAYPLALLDFMTGKPGLNSKTIVAKIGFGTGISSGLFVEQRITTYDVEPNAPLKEKQRKYFSTAVVLLA